MLRPDGFNAISAVIFAPPLAAQQPPQPQSRIFGGKSILAPSKLM